MARQLDDPYVNLSKAMEEQIVKAINIVIETNKDPKALLFGMATKEPQAEIEGHNLYLATAQVCSANAWYIPMWMEFVSVTRQTAIQWRLTHSKLPQDSVYNKAIMPGVDR